MRTDSDRVSDAQSLDPSEDLPSSRQSPGSDGGLQPRLSDKESGGTPDKYGDVIRARARSLDVGSLEIGALLGKGDGLHLRRCTLAGLR